jgi:hypothetical protein
MKFAFTHNTLTFEGDDIVTDAITSFLSTYHFSKVNTSRLPGFFEVKIKNAKSIISFSDYMRSHKYLLDYNSAMVLYYQTNELLLKLKQAGMYVPVVHIKDFVVVSNGEKEWFVYVGVSDKSIFKAIDGEIIVPLNLNSGAFFSPEIGIKRLPIKVHDPYGSSIYAVGMLVKTCLCGDSESNMDEIYATKLYWAITRSIEERKYLIV